MTGDPIAATTAAIGAMTAATTEASAGRAGQTPESRDAWGRRPVLAAGSDRRAAASRRNGARARPHSPHKRRPRQSPDRTSEHHGRERTPVRCSSTASSAARCRRATCEGGSAASPLVDVPSNVRAAISTDIGQLLSGGELFQPRGIRTSEVGSHPFGAMRWVARPANVSALAPLRALAPQKVKRMVEFIAINVRLGSHRDRVSLHLGGPGLPAGAWSGSQWV
jgi:hypothetical protein